MGLWDDAADIKISREAHLTFPFSPFTFQFVVPRTHRSPRGAPPNVRSFAVVVVPERTVREGVPLRTFVRSLWEENETMGPWDVAATN